MISEGNQMRAHFKWISDYFADALLLRPSSGALILPIPLGEILKQVFLGKLWQLIFLLLRPKGIPKLHPENAKTMCGQKLRRCNATFQKGWVFLGLNLSLRHLSAKSQKRSRFDSSSPQTLDFGCWKTIRGATRDPRSFGWLRKKVFFYFVLSNVS